MRLLACLLLALVVAATLPAAADAAGRYDAPVDRPVVDPFRPPATPYGPGNRGLDYATEPGEVVRAAAGGEVVFAGRVGLGRHVVVLHDDGIRTSYSFLGGIDVRRGDRVARGDAVGTAGVRLHFGARAGDDHYLDPALLLRGEPPPVHLVPVEQRRAEPERSERFHLLRSLIGSTARAGVGGVAWARDQTVAAAHVAVDTVRARLEAIEELARLVVYYTDTWARLIEVGQRAWSVYRSQRGCTPASSPPAPRPPGRRIAVLVGGFGSRSGEAAVLDLDTRALGYADTDVAQFSYRGGQAPGRRRLAGVPVSTYGPDDSEGDVRVDAARLRDLLQQVRAASPGVPVDIVAHSQGGLVVRAALGETTDHLDARLPAVANVITMGTPHHGAELATVNAAIGTNPIGQAVQVGVRELTGDVDPFAPSAAQMAQHSDFIADLADRPLPAGTRVTSIAARGDLTVPALSSELPGATNAVVRLDGPSAHDRLPGSPEAEREVRLALAGQGPTCRNVLGDVLAAAGISLVESAVGRAATTATVLSMLPSG